MGDLATLDNNAYAAGNASTIFHLAKVARRDIVHLYE